MNDVLRRINDRLHELDRRRPWLAQASGIDKNTINTWFQSDRIPRMDFAARIAEALGVTLDWLATGIEPEPILSDPVLAEICALLKGASDEVKQAMLTTVRAMTIRTARSEDSGKLEAG